MIGIILAFGTAFFESLKDVFSKKGLENINEYVVGWSLRFFSFLLFIPILFFIDIPELNQDFWIALIISGVLNSIVTILYMKAIKSSDLSLTVPIVAFTSPFLLLTSPIIVGEFPSLFGLGGVLLIFVGTYMMKIKEKKKGFFEPIKSIFREKGPKLMLLVAFLWSITSNFDKIGVENSSPLFWVFAVNLFLTLILTPLMFIKVKNAKKQITKNIKSLAAVGSFNALALTCQMISISMILVVYTISIKRASIVLSAVLGYYIFKEKNLKERLTGISIILAGIILITFS